MDAASQILHHRLLADLPLAERESILALSAVQTAGKSTTLFREGEPATALFLLEAGRVKLTQLAAGGQEVILRYMGPGEIFAANVLRAVSGHTREALSRVRELATEAVPQRLARTLLRLARQIGRPGDDGSLSLERITQQELAEIAGTTLYTVSRTLADWSTAGIVETRRQAVRIVSPGRLEQIGGT